MKKRDIKIIQNTVKSSGLELFTEAFGSPENVAMVLISGAMAPADFWSSRFCKLASKHYFVIRYDHRDIGRSSAVDFDLNPYGIKDLAEDAINILTAYNIENAHFVGHSMGGYICQHIALEHPEKALSITLVSSGPIAKTKIDEIPLTEQEELLLSKTWDLFLKREIGRSVDDKINEFMKIWKYLNGVVPFDEDVARRYTKKLLRSPPQFILPGNNHERAMKNVVQDKVGIVEKITTPTHVIHGNRDPIALPRYGRALGVSIPGAWLDMIDGMGHVFFNKDLEKKILNIIHLYIDQL